MSSAGSSAGSSLGQKIKGAFQTVHGIGESIRGNSMDFVDSATGTAQRGHGATIRGQEEAQVGVANMEGGHHHASTAPLGATNSAAGGVETVMGQNTTGTGVVPTSTATAPSATPAGATTQQHTGQYGAGAGAGASSGGY